MVMYDFKREDNGEIVEKSFPIGLCPQYIICDDGVKAKKIFSTPAIMFKEGQETSSKLKSMNEHMRKANIAAGEKGRKEWKERMPKLKLE